MRKIFPFLIALLLLVLLGMYIFQIELTPERTVSTTTFVDEPIEGVISFASYIKDIPKYSGTNISLRGKLVYIVDGTEDFGLYKGAITDDIDRAIWLTGLTKSQIELCKQNNESKIYNVSGTFDKFGKTEIKAQSIEISNRYSGTIKREKVIFKNMPAETVGSKVFETFKKLTS
jgi:hypothetical protein